MLLHINTVIYALKWVSFWNIGLEIALTGGKRDKCLPVNFDYDGKGIFPANPGVLTSSWNNINGVIKSKFKFNILNLILFNK